MRVVVMQSPPSRHNPMYLDYMHLMKPSNTGPPLDYEVMEEVDKMRPHSVVGIEKLRRQHCPSDLYRKIRDGMVVRCHLHKITISNLNDKYDRYTRAEDTLPVVVKFRYFEGTIIPFGEPKDTRETNRHMGTVPLVTPMVGYDDVNEDPFP
eukprot:CAMPEP_0172308910 /NCGR_PEP_ID=MMETSP1058-20130122/9367_1 /TAXON_ID=83371 /ORGANISM="Detonula confervacea, Strain CCMP 353" /LENGTH=150 /DNA_ID=CAMNT_0013021437 /DNA_START=186 /DNA_END=638 /DNA_ORIENTATION=-